MEMDRFKAAWQQQPLEGAATKDTEDIMREVLQRAARLQGQVRQRDLLETSSAVVVMAVFGVLAWYLPQPMARAGAIIVVLACVQVIVRLHGTRTRRATAPNATARQFCADELERIDDQIALLSSVGTWYVAPLLGGVVVFEVGLVGGTLHGAVLVLIAAIMGVVIYWANRRAVTRDLLPIRADLLQTMNDLADGNGRRA